jgi:cytochrome P450
MSIEPPPVQTDVRSGAHDLASRAFFADPDITFDRLRADDPVHWHDPLWAWVLTRYDDNHATIRDARFSVDRNGAIARGDSQATREKLAYCNSVFTRWMVFSDPPDHGRMRALAGRVFTADLVEELRPAAVSIARELLSRVKREQAMDLVADYASPLPSRAMVSLLGLPPERGEDLRRWSAAMFRFFGAAVATDEIVGGAHDALTSFEQLFASRLAEVPPNPRGDLVARIAALRASGDAGARDALDLCMTLVVGAYETTSHLLATAAWALLQHPEQMQRLRAEPKLVESAVEEAFRWAGPALSVVRRATQDVELRGKRIAAGERVYCMLHAANRDPARFVDPQRFRLSRQDNRHLGLGGGIHFCLGAFMTRLEARVGLQVLLDELVELRSELTTPEWNANLAMRGLAALPVSFRARER